jgi:hypothetical protein
VLDAVGLRATGRYEEIPESNITGAVLPSGWFVIIGNRGDPTFAHEASLLQLSRDFDVLTWFVEEHVMCSSAGSWRGGREVWSVQHSADQGINNLEVKGELPPNFASIRDGLRARQQNAGGEKADVDYIFDIPVELIQSITGYRHDKVIPELREVRFEILARNKETPQRSWIRRLLGR